MNRRLAQLACGAFGVILFLLYFSRHPVARSMYQTILDDYWQIIAAFALVVGVVSYLKISLVGIQRNDQRFFRIVGLLGLFAMPVFAALWGIQGGTPFMWTFENIQVPIQSTVFALLAFFVASASYRGFRARSLPATVLLIAALLLLLTRSNIGGSGFAWLGDFTDWLRNYPSMSARRAILIGIGLGSLTTSLRVILGIERNWLGGVDETRIPPLDFSRPIRRRRAYDESGDRSENARLQRGPSVLQLH